MTEQELMAELVELNARIDPLVERRVWVNRELIILRSPFKPGDKITWSDGSRTGVVVSVLAWEKVWGKLSVRNILKNGCEGRIRSVYSYQKPVKLP